MAGEAQLQFAIEIELEVVVHFFNADLMPCFWLQKKSLLRELGRYCGKACKRDGFRSRSRDNTPLRDSFALRHRERSIKIRALAPLAPAALRASTRHIVGKAALEIIKLGPFGHVEVARDGDVFGEENIFLELPILFSSWVNSAAKIHSGRPSMYFLSSAISSSTLLIALFWRAGQAFAGKPQPIDEGCRDRGPFRLDRRAPPCSLVCGMRRSSFAGKGAAASTFDTRSRREHRCRFARRRILPVSSLRRHVGESAGDFARAGQILFSWRPSCGQRLFFSNLIDEIGDAPIEDHHLAIFPDDDVFRL